MLSEFKKGLVLGLLFVVIILIYVNRDHLFVKRIQIQILNKATKQTVEYSGDGYIDMHYQPQQVTTDFRNKYEAFFIRKPVRNGKFWLPMRLVPEVYERSCFEGCAASFDLNPGTDSCYSSALYNQDNDSPNIMTFVCD